MPKINDGNVQARNILVKESVQVILKKLALDMLPSGSPNMDSEESEAFMEACLMCFFATGEEHPHEILERIPDFLLDKMASMLDISKIPNHARKLTPYIQKLAQLCLIEWCRRHGHLNGDWVWKWDVPPQGHVLFNPKIPLDEALKILLESS